MEQANHNYLQQLQHVFNKESLLLDPADCWAYGYDNSRRQSQALAVVVPSNHQQIVDTVKLCNRHHIAITARGSGTGTTGASVPSENAIVMSTERMDRIIRIDPKNRLMVVEPGVTNQAIQRSCCRTRFCSPARSHQRSHLYGGRQPRL